MAINFPNHCKSTRHRVAKSLPVILMVAKVIPDIVNRIPQFVAAWGVLHIHLHPSSTLIEPFPTRRFQWGLCPLLLGAKVTHRTPFPRLRTNLGINSSYGLATNLGRRELGRSLLVQTEPKHKGPGSFLGFGHTSRL